MSRWKAAGIHLALSALLIGAVMAVTFVLWYPSPLGELQGVLKPAWILTVVDITIGPFLTLVVYKAGKKSLKMDLSVIALIQVVALGGGIWTIEQGRPVVVASSVDRFRLVTAQELIGPSGSWFTRPEFVYARVWQDPMAAMEVISGERPEHHLVRDNYRPIKQGIERSALRPLTAARLAEVPEAIDRYEAWLASLDVAQGDVLLFPLNGRSGDGSILIDAEDGSVVAMSPIDFEGLLPQQQADSGI